MQFWKFFVFTISLFFLIKNFREFFSKIYNPYNKDVKKANKKKQIVYNGIYE